MLKVDQIDVYHGDLQALWGVSLEVGKGELVCLIGTNGAGKTTIVESISCLLVPAAGSIWFNEERLDNKPAHRAVQVGICLIPEDKGIFRGMSVLENLELGAFNPNSRKQRYNTFKFVYELFPLLESRRNQIAGSLSGGEQQMLAIARALMARPKLLMCDEPSLGLAPIVVKNIFAVIGQISQSGVGILLVEQNVRAALKLAQRGYVIENGRVVSHGNAADLLNDEKVGIAYLGTT